MTDAVAIASQRTAPDAVVSEAIPFGTGRRDVHALVTVGHGAGRYNFAIPRPKGGMPRMLHLGDRILHYVGEADGGPAGKAYEYEELALTAVAVDPSTRITYPGRPGPARTLAEWRALAEAGKAA